MLDFMELDIDRKRPDRTTKKTFILNFNNVRKFLDIDPDYSLWKHKDEEEAEEDVCLSFTKKGQNTINNIKIKVLDGRIYEFTYFEIVNDSDIANESVVEIRAGDLKALQILVKYAMPSMLGWNGANDPRVAGMFHKKESYQ